MNTDTQDNESGNSRSGGCFWLWWLGIATMLYVLSSGPLMLTFDKRRRGYRTLSGQVLEVVYSPLTWSYRHTLLKKPLGMHWHLFEPELFDGKGNLIQLDFDDALYCFCYCADAKRNLRLAYAR